MCDTPTIADINTIYDKMKLEQDQFDERLLEIKNEYYHYSKQNMDDSLKVLKSFVNSIVIDNVEWLEPESEDSSESEESSESSESEGSEESGESTDSPLAHDLETEIQAVLSEIQTTKVVEEEVRALDETIERMAAGLESIDSAMQGQSLESPDSAMQGQSLESSDSAMQSQSLESHDAVETSVASSYCSLF